MPQSGAWREAFCFHSRKSMECKSISHWHKKSPAALLTSAWQKNGLVLVSVYEFEKALFFCRKKKVDLQQPSRGQWGAGLVLLQWRDSSQVHRNVSRRGNGFHWVCYAEEGLEYACHFNVTSLQIHTKEICLVQH